MTIATKGQSDDSDYSGAHDAWHAKIHHTAAGSVRADALCSALLLAQ
ncbi:hypothetical protein EV653_0068 [Kribbella pratensis]|uniref:Uncharacterized protein n=1 Tax=Kribbella pratensis TaxID=2512112 RepID=A0A4R8CF90_9ACTN|nr:hypothetical protein EV653_0068 [Kribbella pratensis]